MGTAAFPAVIAALVTVADTALPTVRVERSADVTNEESDVVIIGGDPAGDFQQTMQTFGGNREEVGTVNGLIYARDGDGDQDITCVNAFDYLAAIEAAVRADKTLGLTQFDYVVAEFQAGEVTESPNDEGALTVITFGVTYKIRI
jgi:hypothetical protein